MPLIPITSIDDPRLEVYRDLKRSNLTRWSGRFIAEGAKVVERLLASDFPVESVLVSERRIEQVFPTAVPDVPVLIVLRDSPNNWSATTFMRACWPAADASRPRISTCSCETPLRP